jgi:hypothetical protein
MEYPNHEFSKYIDNDFSFNGVVQNKKSNKSVIDKLGDLQCNDIMLEPRLLEFLRKKEYYKKNNINSAISPEKEYMITNNDIKKIKMFIRGQKDIYNNKHHELNTNTFNKTKFPSARFKKDKRVKNIKKPNKNTGIKNMGMFVPDEGRSFYEGKVDYNNGMMDSRDFVMNDFVSDPRVDKRIPQNVQSNINNSYNKNYVQGQVDNRRYSSHPHDKNYLNSLVTHEYISGPTRNDNNVGRSTGPIPYEFNVNNTQPMHSMQNNSIPYTENTLRDTILETEMLRGMPTRTMKSYGYRNQEEHHYDFIDPSFQQAANSVLPFPQGGEPTRSSNRRQNRKRYTRKIM